MMHAQRHNKASSMVAWPPRGPDACAPDEQKKRVFHRLQIFAAHARRRPSFGDIRGPQLEPHCAGQRKYPTGYNRHSRGSLHCDSSLGAGSSTAAEITNESCACGASSPGVARASASRRHQRSSSSSAGPTTASCGTSYPSGRQRTKKHK